MPENTPASLDASAFDDVVFARVIDGTIMEYPVLYKHIVNREGKKDQFKQVVMATMPSFDPRLERVEEKIEMVKGIPTVSYSLTSLSIDEILAGLWAGKETLSITDVDPEIFHKVAFLSDTMVTEMLDKFAQSRRYANMASLATYVNDPLQQHRDEADRGVALRSQIYTALKKFEADVGFGTSAVPKSAADILALFPALTW